jgi:hypothetical protein
MKRTRSIVLALAVVFALSVVAASAASAHVFNAKPTGGFPAPITALSGIQQFVSGFNTVTCTMATATGRALKSAELTTEQTVIYEGCTDSIGGLVDPFKALYEFSADLTAWVLQPFVIRLLASGCTLTIEKQGPLSGMKFKNNAAKTELTVESTTTGIVQLGSGGLCTNGTGEYKGSVTDHLTGGGELFWS